MEDKKQTKISIITPCYKDADTLALHIDTLLDQDYTAKEIILVDDGSEDGSKEIIKKYEKKYPGTVKGLYFSKNRGACAARNEGAKVATGDIFSFLPADSFVKPGVLRFWVETMEKNPKAGFLYGGYAFVSTPKPTWMGGQLYENYFSQPFNPRELETGNYIDGSFPIWKNVYWDAAKKVGLKDGLWNPEVKSLQDWDFWLSVVKDLGVPGVYVNSLFFETTTPHAGGLSYDSHRNWVARLKQIKSLHKIPNREICVTSHAAVFHGQSIAKLLDADFLVMPPQKDHEYKMIYEVGFFTESYNSFVVSSAVFLKPEHYQKLSQIINQKKSPEFFGGSKIIHYIGSDVLSLQKLPLDQIKSVRDFTRKCDAVLCELPEIQKELKSFGIEAEVVPFPPRKWFDVRPLPKKKAVAVYMPDVNEDFYFKRMFLGGDNAKGLAHRMKDVDFYFFGNQAETGDLAKNIHMMGRVSNIEPIIEKTNAIVRIVPHDGLSISVAEWIGAGRNAITSVEMPFAERFDLQEFTQKYGKSFTVQQLEKEVVAAIRRAVDKPLNEKGAKHYRKWLDADKYRTKIRSYMKYDEKRYWERRSWNWEREAKEYPIREKELIPWIKKLGVKSVLDIGCGEGRASRMFEKLGIEYSGCDISSHMVEVAKANYPQKNFFVSAAEDLDKNMGYKADLLFVYTCLQHIRPENIDKAVAALKRVGKKMILVEPTELDDRDYCFDHPYEKLFKVIKKKKIDPFRTLYLCDLT